MYKILMKKQIWTSICSFFYQDLHQWKIRMTKISVTDYTEVVEQQQTNNLIHLAWHEVYFYHLQQIWPIYNNNIFLN